MKISSFYPTLFLSCVNLAACQQKVFGAQPLLRNASLQDADDIASVIIAAFSPLPFWKYMYSFREKYPKEHHRCLRLGVTQALTAASWHVEVIEAPVESSLSVTAVAMWRQNLLEGETSLYQLFNKCEHRDMNITRAIDWIHKFDVAKQEYLDIPFGSNQLYLDTLCTHPDFQSHGAGTPLVNRGIELGRGNDVNVTLIAQPTAASFYVHIGFDSIVNISLPSVDEDEYFGYNVMAYNFTSG